MFNQGDDRLRMKADRHYWWGWHGPAAFAQSLCIPQKNIGKQKTQFPPLLLETAKFECISLSCALEWFGTVLTLREQIASVFVNHLAKYLASNKLFINICWMELNQRVLAEICGKSLTICRFSSFKRYKQHIFIEELKCLIEKDNRSYLLRFESHLSQI